MPSTAKVLRRMDKRVEGLIEEMPHWLRSFDAAAKFSGPSLYFHLRTLDCLRRYPSAIDALNSDEFFDWLYATLASWGMHRMGQGSTKLRDLPDIKSSVRAQVTAIERLQDVRLSRIDHADLQSIFCEVWRLLDSITVSIAEVKIVANSKVIHHILPNLLPPIDRTYTYNFFYNRNMLSISEEEAFWEMFVRFYRIGINCEQLLQDAVGEGWYTSETKVIDNAIVGYVVEALRAKNS
jgi:hypothetical protein